MNKEFNTKLKINDFFYQSKFNNKLKCIEGFVISKKKQSFYIGKTKIFLRRHEGIQTEISKKFTLTEYFFKAITSFMVELDALFIQCFSFPKFVQNFESQKVKK